MKRCKFYQRTENKWAKLQNSLYLFLCQLYVSEHLARTMYLNQEPVVFVKLVNVAV